MQGAAVPDHHRDGGTGFATARRGVRAKNAALNAWWRVKSFAAVFVAAAALSACQSSQTSDVLSLEPGQEDAVQAAAREVFGQGQTEIGLVLALNGAFAGEARAIRNGAVLALEDLGGDQLKLTVADSPDNGSPAPPLADVPVRAVGVFPASASAWLPAGIPAVVFAQNGAPAPAGAFTFMSSSDDTLVAAMAYAGAGKANAAVFAPQGYPAAQLEKRLSQAGLKAQLVTYEPSQAASAIAERLTATPDLAGFTASDGQIPEIAALVKQRSGGTLPLAGNSGWSGDLRRNALLEGAIIARPDTRNRRLISDRYRKRFGTPPAEMAYYGYDFIAMIAGIVRARGAGGLAREAFVSPSGFTGVTGSFRFRADGQVERLFEYVALQRNGVKKLHDAPAGF